MASAKDSLVDVERYRLQLEESVAKLRASLQHWRTWELDYECIKEELHLLEKSSNCADMTDIASNFECELLNETEIRKLLLDANGRTRDRKQVIDLASRRIDYVQENIKAIEKQLANAEKKLDLSRHIARPELRDEEGLPLTEIREELDEEGNVISGVATASADTAPHIVEALRKAGVNDLPDTSKRKRPTLKSQTTEESDDITASRDTKSSRSVTAERKLKENQSPSSPEKPSIAKNKGDSLGRKKSVSFAEGTKTEDAKVSRKRQPNPIFARYRNPPAVATAETLRDVQQKPPQDQLTALLNAEANLLRGNPNDDSDDAISSPVIPENESPEDAALRRQMLQYNMQEVGAVVAEIDLDDDASTPPYSEDEDDYDYDDSSVEEEEDEHGRAMNIVFSDEYIKTMKDMEQRLNASMLENVGPSTNSETSLLSQLNELNVQSTDPGKVDSPTKIVRFAEELDVPEAPMVKDKHPQATLPETTLDDEISAAPKRKISRFKGARQTEAHLPIEDQIHQPTKQRSLQPVSGDIIERPLTNMSTPPTPKPAAAATNQDRIPMSSPNRPHTDIVERPYSSISDTPPQEPDEFNPELLQQQVKVEYNRQRNNMIYRQGGFLQTEEDEEADVPIDEHGVGEGGRKISRFKAARLGRS